MVCRKGNEMKCAMLLRHPPPHPEVWAVIECPTTARGEPVKVVTTIGSLDGRHYYDLIGWGFGRPVYRERLRKNKKAHCVRASPGR